MKQCIKCSTEFEGRSNRKYCSKQCGDTVRRDRWLAADPDRAKALRKRRNEKHKVSMRDSHLKLKYGLTRDVFNSMMMQQNNKCCICSVHIQEFSPNTTHRACVDHDHDTGKVRGILCHSCNRGLGAFQDSPKIIDRAINYLQSTR